MLEDPAGADHQEPLGSLDLVDQTEQAHDLVGLAEPHVVGEESADPREIAVPQPGDAFALVGAEAGPETGWIGALRRRSALEQIGERGEALIAAGDRAARSRRPGGSGDPGAEEALDLRSLRQPEAGLLEEIEIGCPNDGLTDAGEALVEEFVGLGPIEGRCRRP